MRCKCFTGFWTVSIQNQGLLIDRRKIPFHPCLLSQLYPNEWFSFPDVSLSTVGVLWVFLAFFPHRFWKGSECSHILKPRLQTIYASFSRNKQNLIVFPIVRACSFYSCVVKPIKWYTDSFKTWFLFLCVKNKVFLLVAVFASHHCCSVLGKLQIYISKLIP